MIATKRAFVAINLTLGPLVPLSYVFAARFWPDQLGGLWGSIPETWRTPYTANMPLAALGYLVFSAYFLRGWGELREVPWGRINLAYLLVLVPSMVWMPLTSHALASQQPLELVIQLVLVIVAVGSLMVAQAVMKAEPPSPLRTLARVGALFFCLQTVVLDALIWPRYFAV